MINMYIRNWEKAPILVKSDLTVLWSKKQSMEEFTMFFRAAAERNLLEASHFAYDHKKEAPDLAEHIFELLGIEIQKLEAGDITQAIVLWKVMLYLFVENNKEETITCAREIYEKLTFIRDDEKRFPEKRVKDARINLIMDAIKDDKIAYSSLYIRTMYLLRYLLESSDHSSKEVHFKDALYLDMIDPFTRKLTGEYMETLMESQNYRTCGAFMDKCKGVDYVGLFGYTEEEFWEKLLEKNNIPICESYQRVKGYYSSEEMKSWREEISLKVTDEICLAWCDWFCYIITLRNSMDNHYLQEEDFMQMAMDTKPKAQYPKLELFVHKTLANAYQFIYSEIFRREWNVLPFLKLLGQDNLYAYENRHYIMVAPNANEKYRDTMRKHDWDLNYELFHKAQYNNENCVYIYMNTPLRLAVDFNTFVIDMGNRSKASEIGTLFGSYELDGRLSYTDNLRSQKGKYRFELDSRLIHTKYFYKNKKRKDAEYYNSLLFLDEKWIEKNEVDLIGIARDTKAKFRVSGFKWKGRNHGTIFVADLKDYEKIDLNPMAEMQKILDWMEQIRENKTYIPVEKKDFLYVYPLKDLGLQKQFALEILKTIYALIDTESDIVRFIKTINAGRFDKISEFQYILRQFFVKELPLEQEELEAFRTEVNTLGACIAVSPVLSKNMKINIYMNTCLKVYYPLEQFWQQVNLQEEDMVSLSMVNCEYDKFLFLVEYKGEGEGKGLYELAPSFKILLSEDSTYQWIGPVQKNTEDTLFRVSIQSIHARKQEISIGDVFPVDIYEPWSECMGKIRDLKETPSYHFLNKTAEKIQALHLDFYAKNRIGQLVREILSLFNRAGRREYPKSYNLEWCTGILSVLGNEDNPFLQKEKTLAAYQFADFEIQHIKNEYKEFMERMYANLANDRKYFYKEDMEKFLFTSPFFLVFSKEELEESLKQYEQQYLNP